MDLPLTKLSETTRVITFGWTPVPCIGYVFYTNDKRVSNTWNPEVKQIQFAKIKDAVYKVVAVGVVATGIYPPPVLPNSEAYSLDPYGTDVYSH